MSKKRILADRNLTGMEKKRRVDDIAASIDQELDEAIKNIDLKRKTEAEKSLLNWINTYCIGILLDDPPPKKAEEVLKKMETSITAHKNYMICLPRGSGKSSYVICTALFALCTGLQKYVVIISQNARSAQSLLSDLWRAWGDRGSTLSQDYPEVFLPYQLCNGSYRRRQLYKNESTNLSKTSSNLVLPKIKGSKTSESIISVKGITSGIRGLKYGTLRPSMIILDDLYTSETAENQDQVEKILSLIRKDIIPLGGKERLSILQTATPIVPDDLVDKIKADKSWITTIYPAIIKYPKDMSLWEKYFQMFDRENLEEKNHDESLSFYRQNMSEMDEGSEVFNPSRFSVKDGHISGLQKLLELKHEIGDSAFASEYQMSPKRYTFALDINPQKILKKISNHPQYVIPEGYSIILASSDLNLSYCISTTIIAYKIDGTGVMIGHIFKPCSISTKLTDAEYYRQVYDLLSQHGRELKELNLKGLKWAIDCNGVPFDAVTDFCKASVAICGIPSVGMIGRSSHIWSENIRSRLRAAQERTILCGDTKEQISSGSGKKWIAWDSDYYREKAQKAMMAEIGSVGSLCLYDGDIEEHKDFSLQFCNEKLMYKRQRQDGRTQYNWRSAEPHDMLDSTAQNFALLASQGIFVSNIQSQKSTQRKIKISHLKPRIKII